MSLTWTVSIANILCVLGALFSTTSGLTFQERAFYKRYQVKPGGRGAAAVTTTTHLQSIHHLQGNACNDTLPWRLEDIPRIMAAGKRVNGVEAPCCPQTPLPIHLALWMVAFKGNFKPHLWFWTLEAPFVGHKAVSPVSMLIITYAA